MIYHTTHLPFIGNKNVQGGSGSAEFVKKWPTLSNIYGCTAMEIIIQRMYDDGT
jgi:hypothetical protein